MRVKVAVIGATGYGGAELLRHLLFHPGVEVTQLVAKDHVGERIDTVVRSLAGMTDLVVEDAPPAVVAQNADLVFLGLPHRVSGKLACEYADLGLKVIDLSGDMRLLDADAYERFYGVAHPLPERLGSFTYGMPELNRAALQKAEPVMALMRTRPCSSPALAHGSRARVIAVAKQPGLATSSAFWSAARLSSGMPYVNEPRRSGSGCATP